MIERPPVVWILGSAALRPALREVLGQAGLAVWEAAPSALGLPDPLALLATAAGEPAAPSAGPGDAAPVVRAFVRLLGGGWAPSAGGADYRALIEGLEQGIFLKDPAGRYVAANRAFCQWLGRPESALLDRTDADIFPAQAETLAAAERQVLAGERVEQEGSWPSGDPGRILRTVRTALRDDRGEVQGVVGTCWDVTEQRRREEQARQAQKMEALGKLAGGIAHDFNNLLTVILGHASLLLETLSPAGPERALAEVIEQTAHQATELTGQLLRFARREPVHPRPVDLNVAVREVLSMLARTTDPRIERAARPRPQPAVVRADLGQMRQVLMNLCLNSCDAMPDGGTLTLGTEEVTFDAVEAGGHPDGRPGTFVYLWVADTGTGIAPEILPRIFEPFFTKKGPGHGTGLGLAMVRSIVEQHQGWIECHSEVGCGTRFDIYLPRADGEIAAGAAPTDRPALPPGRGTILVVENEPLIRDLVRTVLQRQEYRVRVASDGREALEAFGGAGGLVDLVVLDQALPVLSGLDVVHALIGINPRVRVLLTSGYPPHLLPDETRHLLRGFLSKPFTPDQLLRAVRDALSDPPPGDRPALPFRS